jgi:hypothetical protein
VARAFAEARTIGRIHQPEHCRQIEHGVEEDSVRRPESQQDRAADRRADQDAKITRRGVEAHPARQISGADDVIE